MARYTNLKKRFSRFSNKSNYQKHKDLDKLKAQLRRQESFIAKLKAQDEGRFKLHELQKFEVRQTSNARSLTEQYASLKAELERARAFRNRYKVQGVSPTEAIQMKKMAHDMIAFHEQGAMDSDSDYREIDIEESVYDFAHSYKSFFNGKSMEKKQAMLDYYNFEVASFPELQLTKGFLL